MKWTEELASFAAERKFEDLPPEVVQQVKLTVLDTLGCGLGGYTLAAEEVSWILSLIKNQGCSGPSTVFCDGFKTSSAYAALANGTMIHTVDFDDTHVGSVGHLGSSLVATAFAMGEQLKSRGTDVITAFTLGFEVAARVGRSVMPTHYNFWHPTATVGLIGSAVAGAKLLGLDAERMELVIGHAADQTGGLRYCIDSGDFSKSLHPGFAAMKGVLLSLVVSMGATGPKGILEYPTGFCNAYSAEPKLEPLTADLGKDYEVMQDTTKAYPAIQCAQAPVQATLSVMRKHNLRAEDIEQIDIRRADFPAAATKNQGCNYSPATPLAAHLSIPFCVGLAAYEGRVGLDQFTHDKLKSPRIKEVMSKIKITPDPKINTEYPNARTAVFVDVKVKGGRAYSESVIHAKGEPDNRMTPDEVRDKFRGLASNTFDHGRVEVIIEAIRDLEKVEDFSKTTHILVK